jgi:hypothetical protein
MKSKFAVVMTIYALLALIACFVLDGKVRLVVFIFLGGLAVKTLIARAAGW